MLLEHGLHLGGVDVLAAPDDAVRAAVDDPQTAGLRRAGRGRRSVRVHRRATGRLADVSRLRDGPATTISPTPSAPGRRCVRVMPGSGRPADPGAPAPRRSAVRSRRSPSRSGRRSGRRATRLEGPFTSAGGIGPPPSRTARSVSGGGGAGRVQQPGELGRNERDVAGRRVDRSARSSAGASAGGTIRIGTPSRIARHSDPQAGHVSEAQRQHPAGRRRQDAEPGVGARGHRPVGQHDGLRPPGRARGQDDHGGCLRSASGGDGPCGARGRARRHRTTTAGSISPRPPRARGSSARRAPARPWRPPGEAPRIAAIGLGRGRHTSAARSPARTPRESSSATIAPRASEPRPRHAPPAVDDRQVVRPRRGELRDASANQPGHASSTPYRSSAARPR